MTLPEALLLDTTDHDLFTHYGVAATRALRSGVLGCHVFASGEAC